MTWPHREVQESWFRSALWLCVAWGNSVPSSGPQFHEVKHESWIAGCVGIFPGHTPSPQSPRSTDKAHNCRTAPFQLRWKINASSVSQAASSSTPRDPHNNTSIHPTPASFSLLSFDVQRAEKFTMPFFFFNGDNMLTNPNEILFWDPAFWLQVASSFWSCLHPGSSLLNFLFSLERQRVSPATHCWIPVNLSLSPLTAGSNSSWVSSTHSHLNVSHLASLRFLPGSPPAASSANANKILSK